MTGMDEQTLTAQRMARIRSHHRDAPCGLYSNSDECFLLAEHDALVAEVRRLTALFITDEPLQNALVERDRLLDGIRAALTEAATWGGYDTRDIGRAYREDTVHDLLDDLRALLPEETK
jgi:hypothetical protein